jgi:hypothetical protein
MKSLLPLVPTAIAILIVFAIGGGPLFNPPREEALLLTHFSSFPGVTRAAGVPAKRDAGT